MSDDQKQTPMDTIATFAELSLLDKRWLTLYADRVFVRRKLSNGTETEGTVYLDRLNPEAGRGKQKKPLFAYALFLLVFGIFLLHVFTQPFEIWSRPLRPIDWAALSCIFLGIVGVVVGFRSFDFCHFSNRDGIIVLSVRCLGSDTATYEKFVGVLIRQIQVARQMADIHSKNTP